MMISYDTAYFQHMLMQVSFLRKCASTFRADKTFGTSCVNERVRAEVGLIRESFIALWEGTVEWPLASVGAHMTLQ